MAADQPQVNWDRVKLTRDPAEDKRSRKWMDENARYNKTMKRDADCVVGPLEGKGVVSELLPECNMEMITINYRR